MAHSKVQNDKLKILLIGPFPLIPLLGGTPVSFSQLVQEMSTHPGVDVKVIDTVSVRNLMSIIKMLLRILSQAPKFDVISFHASNRGVLLFGPILWCICKGYRKPFLMRIFGGSFDQEYTSLSKFGKWLIRRTVLNADFCLLQTKHLVQFFTQVASKPVWYSNSRPIIGNMTQAEEKTSARRFIFIGHMVEAKGIHEIITAGEQLDSSITVDLYGPLLGNITEQDFAGLKTVRYRGVLEHQKVIPTLQTYDALLLPTYYQGEGYPGVILEAYSAGLPVLATRWKAIPEIVDETSGILIEPKEPEQLLAAMKKLIVDDQFYQTLSQGVAQKRDFFSSERWTNEFAKLCKSVLR